MQKIISITEAFSQQPPTLSVGKDGCDKIVLESKSVGRDGGNIKYCDVYIGYNTDGLKLFEYLKSSVNVCYAPEYLRCDEIG